MPLPLTLSDLGKRYPRHTHWPAQSHVEAMNRPGVDRTTPEQGTALYDDLRAITGLFCLSLTR